jgi:uncharacterized protein (TIRG00374 family)
MSKLIRRLIHILLEQQSTLLIASFIALGTLLYLGIVFWIGWKDVSEAFFILGLEVLVIGGAISSSSYLWRFIRWEWALNCLGNYVPRMTSLLVYFSGLALTSTPGKSGEIFRSAILIHKGVRVSHSLAAFLADRGSDVIGMILLGGIASVVVKQTVPTMWLAFFILASVGTFVFARLILVSNFSADRSALIFSVKRLPIKWCQATLQAWARIWNFPRVLLFSAIAVVAYGTQAMVFFWFCEILGTGLSIYECILIFAQATLFGAATLIPGGLGTMEAAIVFQLMHYGVDLSIALALAISIRLVTLWLGMAIGVLSLFLIRILEKPN